MLRLLLGRAGSGKTTKIMQMVCEAAQRGETGQILFVPDQYSHEAERELCERGGNAISLSAEVLTFTRLVTRVKSLSGGLAEPQLDEGGRLLVMQRALETVKSALKVYGVPSRRPEYIKSFVDTLDELKSCRISPEELGETAAQVRGPAGDKLSDLALIFGAYDAVAAQIAADPRDALTRAEEQIGPSGFAAGAHIYIDGFAGFTPQEAAAVGELMKTAREMTVALTCDELSAMQAQGLFSRAKGTAAQLAHMAQRLGKKVEIINLPPHQRATAKELRYLEAHLLDYGCPAYEGPCGALEFFTAENPFAECEAAAARILSLVRGGCRYRDIAVVSRVFSGYESMVSTVFERYGIPVFMDRTSDILQKPVLLLVTAALDVLTSDFEYEAVFRYLKTGLAGLLPEACDRLENYVLKWNIRGGTWTRQADWDFNPNGYTDELSDADRESLTEINDTRKEVAAPLQRFSRAAKKAETALEQAQALFSFLEEIGLETSIAQRQEKLLAAGRLQQADEYAQLWDILCGALEQCAYILKETAMDLARFSDLLKLVLSQYDVGTIPVALDRVSAGGAERMRRRNVRHVFVLGATDGAMPLVSRDTGLLSDDEREKLEDFGLNLTPTVAQRMDMELDTIYSVFTMPSDALHISWPAVDEGGSKVRPSFITARLQLLFPGLVPVRNKEERIKTAAPGPCLELAAGDRYLSRETAAASAAARAYFAQQPGFAARLARMERAGKDARGPLGSEAVEALFGKTIRMSASRMDQYRTCRFSYFMKFGLKAQPRRPAGFEAPEIGTFIHYILEKTVGAVVDAGGFDAITPDDLKTLVRHYTQEYVQKVIGGLENKTARFRYLFSRLAKMAQSVVLNTAEELQQSEFRPLDYELHFAEGGDLPAVSAELESGAEVNLTGYADRVDGWVKDGVLYLRIVDYKTGIKKFDLSDIWYGLSMQMLLYLFALEKYGSDRYEMPVKPAGVLYVPAREVLLRADRETTDEQLQRLADRQLRRSGLVLDETEVIRAMEKGADTEGRFIPVKFNRDGTASVQSSVASAEQIGRLRRHMDMMLSDIGKLLRKGRIEADPYYKSRTDIACNYCEFYDACHFDPDAGQDKPRYLRHLARDQFWSMLDKKEDS